MYENKFHDLSKRLRDDDFELNDVSRLKQLQTIEDEKYRKRY